MVRERSAKPLCDGSNPSGASEQMLSINENTIEKYLAGVAELVDAQDLKSCGP